MQILKFNYLFLSILFCVSLLSCTPKEHSSSMEGSSQNTENSTSEDTDNSSSNSEDTNSENTGNIENSDGGYTLSYKMGAEPRIEDKGEGLSASLSKKYLEDRNGQKYYHTLLSFYVRYQNRISFQIDIIDKNVVETMNGNYPFTEDIHFTVGEAQNFMTIMIVDGDGNSQPFASKETSTANVKFDGKNIKISIKNASVTGMQDDEVTIPFEFELDAKNVEVTKDGF